MGAYAFATTVLSTYFIDGSIPRNLHEFKPEMLSDESKETIE